MITGLLNLCQDCKHVDDSPEFSRRGYEDQPVCMYKRQQFPRATKCADYEPIHVEDDK